MKKIGIITLSASDNVGSLLQTYALQEYLISNFDCEVDIINFVSDASDRVYKMFTKESYKHPKKTLFTLFHFRSIFKQRQGYQKFRDDYLRLTKKEFRTCEDLESIKDIYDILITGSDQVWNINMSDFDKAFFLPWKDSAKKISYAASLGSTTDIKNPKKDEILEYLKDFYAISVRENTGKATLENIGVENISVTADPTLILDTDKWDNLAGERILKEPYIFFYSWSYPDKNMNKLVEKFSKKMGMPVYVINSSKWYKYRPSQFGFKLFEESGPITYLNLMKYADFVFVQSFHGAVFANVFRKRFFFLSEKGKSNVDFRTKNIMGRLNQEKQIVCNEEHIEEALITDIQYESADFNELIDISKSYLSKVI